MTNTYGEIRVVKPEDRHRQAKKVDGITAIVNAMTEARKHAFPKPSKEYTGTVYRKLGVRNRTEAVQRAQRLGLLV